MFDKEFYPTPESVAHEMCSHVEIANKVVLEPHAGAFDLGNVIRMYNPKSIIVCERNEKLAAICSAQADQFLSDDILKVTSDMISHVDVIIANPPFSNADKHILHLFDIAPEGCTIVSLCNYETLSNTYGYDRKKLLVLVTENGTRSNLGNVFSDAERTTDVEVGLVVLYKPVTTSSEDEFEGYFDTQEEFVNTDSGVMQHDEITNIVNSYVYVVKMFDEVEAASNRMNDVIKPLQSGYDGIKFGATYADNNKRFTTITREVFRKELQKSSWKVVLKKLNADKYLTKSAREIINRFVEQQLNVPFTVKNIYKMLEQIIGTNASRMDKVVVGAFDAITGSTKENRVYQEGWKTNSQFMVNKKFIINWGEVKVDYNYPTMSYRARSGEHKLDDLTKALCYITGQNYDSIGTFSDKVERDYIREEDITYDIKNDPNIFIEESYGYGAKYIARKKWGKWFEFGFFKVKIFKKGTIHCQFLSEEVCNLFNYTAAKHKKFDLAESYTADFMRKSEGVTVRK